MNTTYQDQPLAPGTLNYVAIAREKIAAKYPTIFYGKPSLQDIPPGAIVGTWAISIPHVARIITAKDLELARGVLPADVSRAWIDDTITLPLRRREEQLERRYPLPLYASVGAHGDCSYLDIKQAYLGILGFGYDVEYLHGKYIGANPQPIPKVIADNKFCYSISVSMSAAKRTNIQMMGKAGIFGLRKFNTYSNPCLYNLASDTLASIASELRAILGNHIVYANTDGVIVHTVFVEAAARIIESWGFRCAIKAQGETFVYGVGAWKCGDKRTRRLITNGRDTLTPMPTKDERLWLKAALYRWRKVGLLLQE